MIEVVRYTSDRKKEWDEFVGDSDIPIFIFFREYMDYHKDRFCDYSILIYRNKKLVAVFPAHIKDRTIYSHEGLTFGGLITKRGFGYANIVEIYNNINKYFFYKGVYIICIKLQPSFYSETYNQGQLYLMQKNIKSHIDLKLSTCIYTKQHVFPKSTVERRKLKLDQFNLRFSDDFIRFWKILEQNLSKFHDTKPVHSIEEILYLKSLFPNEILLFVAENNNTGEIDSGAVLYKFKNVLKLQYLAASIHGRTNRASHALYYSFISEFINKVDYIDLGSCMDDIDEINHTLLYIKERFGATVYPMTSYQFGTSFEFI